MESLRASLFNDITATPLTLTVKSADFRYSCKYVAHRPWARPLNPFYQINWAVTDEAIAAHSSSILTGILDIFFRHFTPIANHSIFVLYLSWHASACLNNAAYPVVSLVLIWAAFGADHSYSQYIPAPARHWHRHPKHFCIDKTNKAEHIFLIWSWYTRITKILLQGQSRYC